MNLKNRIKKLEKTTDTDGFCACRKIWMETYFQDLSEDSENIEPVLHSEPAPDVCKQCNKPTRKEQMIIQFVDNTTIERFPEEWNR